MPRALWLTLIRNFTYSTGIAFLCGVIDQYRFQKLTPDPRLSQTMKNAQKSDQYQMMLDVFANMGADLSKKNLRVSMTEQQTGILAGSASTPFYENYDVIISMPKIKRLSAQTGLPSSDILQAITAHEAAHAIENHKFIITCLSSFFSMTIFDISRYKRIPMAPTFMISSAVCAAMYATLSKQIEYRADELAAQQNPTICNTLIHILSVTNNRAQTNKPLSLHPSNEDRINRLRKINFSSN